jgi:hypothetical protein
MGDVIVQFLVDMLGGSGQKYLPLLLLVFLGVMGLVVLLILVNEVSRMRFMEYNERLSRNIWNDKKEMPDIPWNTEPEEGRNPWKEQLGQTLTKKNPRSLKDFS